MHKMGWMSFFNWKNLPYALNNPTAIFKGLARDGHEHSFCYVSKPVRYWTGEGPDDWRRNDPTLVFTVYMMGTLEIYSWKFEKADIDNNYPVNYKERYGELLWSKH